MSNEIRILSEELVDKIAAGEVVERPASVVKELLENSIDAGAKSIDIEIKNGGIKYIRVTDDGVGMDEKNAALAFQRHATSKITSTDDLFRIDTLGFRGEALPSIASVCFLDLLTRTGKSLSGQTPARLGGTRLKIEGGVVKESKQMGSPVGTSVIVRELFYNVPARRKFLKTVLTETRHVIDLITKFSIAYPEISFRLTSDGRELFRFAKVQVRSDRLRDIFGKDRFEKTIEIQADDGLPRISGFLGKPEIARSNRAELYLFVNRRPIASRSLYHAVQSGYGELLPRGKYPFAILLLEVDPQTVDVNVHPTKNEVRFTDERGMHDLVHSQVKKTLSSSEVITQFRTKADDSRVSEMSTFTPSKESKTQTDRAARNASPWQSVPFITEPREESRPAQKSFLADPGDKPSQSPSTHSDPHEKKEAPVERKLEAVTSNLWQLADTYILTQVRGSLMILDQHAAHERILYQQALRNLTEKDASSQQVLFPAVLELTPKEFQILEEHKDLIGKLGFELKHFGGRSVLVTAVPSLIRNKSGEVFLREILGQMEEEGRNEKDRVKVVAKSFACHGSVKAGERLTREEMGHLIQQLFATDEPYSCPHGRPTVIDFPLAELNKKFGRS